MRAHPSSRRAAAIREDAEGAASGIDIPLQPALRPLLQVLEVASPRVAQMRPGDDAAGQLLFRNAVTGRRGVFARSSSPIRANGRRWSERLPVISWRPAIVSTARFSCLRGVARNELSTGFRSCALTERRESTRQCRPVRHRNSERNIVLIICHKLATSRGGLKKTVADSCGSPSTRVCGKNGS